MEYRVLETRSADILTKYYSNEIDSFLNACPSRESLFQNCQNYE